MRIVIIGGKGHVGTYLVPRLVEGGHEVICITRGQREPYQPHAAWKAVRQLTLDRAAEEAIGAFGPRVRDLQPDAVIDMICFTLDSARHLVEALRDQVQHFLHCGTIWVHGPSMQVPTSEEQPRRPFGEYGIQKAAIETYLLNEARALATFSSWITVEKVPTGVMVSNDRSGCRVYFPSIATSGSSAESACDRTASARSTSASASRCV